MGTWYTTIATATELGGTDLVDDLYDIVISPVDPDTGMHSGTYIQASHFKIGGSATETSTGSGVWQSGNLDSGIASVTFTDLGTAGSINNTVKARVKMGTISPEVDTSFHIDIDEKTTGGTTQVATRVIWFNVKIPDSDYWTHAFYQPWSNAWVPQSAVNGSVTRVLLSSPTAANPWYKYRFSGTIDNYQLDADYEIVKIGAFRTNPSTQQLLDASPSASTVPDFNPHNHYFTYNTVNTAIQFATYYPDAYSTALAEWHAPQIDVEGNISDQPGVPYALSLTISYNPPDTWVGWVLDQYLGWLGHTITWNFDVTEPLVEIAPNDDEVTGVQIPTELDSTSGYQTIVVRGTVGATYELSITERTSLKDFTPTKFYNFTGVGRLKTTYNGKNKFIIDSSGRNKHIFMLPDVTEKKMYDVVLSPVGSTTIKDGLPTKLGDKTFMKTGYNTLTIRATAATEANWDLSGTGTSVRDAVISRKEKRRK